MQRWQQISLHFIFFFPFLNFTPFQRAQPFTTCTFWSGAALEEPFTLLSHRQKISHLCLPHIDSTADLWHAVLWAPSWGINPSPPPPDHTHIRPKLRSPRGPPSPLQSDLFAIRLASHAVRLLYMTPERRLTCGDVSGLRDGAVRLHPVTSVQSAPERLRSAAAPITGKDSSAVSLWGYLTALTD